MLMPTDETREDAFFKFGPRFETGQLVRHRRYGYRGVVVAFDPFCRADDAWYQSNKTQPLKNQPWYHVLVHEANGNTYAAEINLTADESGEPVTHPLVEHFFSGFENGKYIRNGVPWVM